MKEDDVIKSIEKLELKDNDFVHIKVSDSIFDEEMKELERIFGNIFEKINHNVTGFIGKESVNIEKLSEANMKALGWYRK